MKKTILISMGLLFTANSFSQNWGANEPLNSIIKPYESRGYICWSPVPSANYVVNIFEKDSTGTLNLVGRKSTENNYARLGSNFTNENYFYSVSAFNNGNGVLIETGDVQAAGEGAGSELICVKKCNGRNYAYEFRTYDPSPGAPLMSVGGTNFSVDEVTDIVVPYWHAMSFAAFDALPANHPYLSATANGFGPEIYDYKRVQIEAGIGGAPLGGPYYDMDGFPVAAGGYLFEKKLNQFEHFDNAFTSSQPSPNLCTIDVSWSVMFFNDGLSVPSLSNPNPEYFYFTNEVPTNEIECVKAINGLGGGSTSNNGDGGLMNDFIDCISLTVYPFDDPSAVSDYLDDFAGCSDALGGGGIISGVSFEALSSKDDGSLVIGVNGSGQAEIIERKGPMGDGLYTVIIYTTDGRVIPTIFEKNSKQGRDDKDFVKLEIAPNKIENDELKFKISSEKDMPVQIDVRKLNGEVSHNEVTTLSKLLDIQREIFVGGSANYNQVRLTLIFDDGSTIQKTALKL